MFFHLVRHGQTEWNVEDRIQGHKDSSLTAAGVAQAVERGRDFDDISLEAVYCSPSLRTRQTASHMLGERAADIVYKDNLRETCVGVWEGRLWADVQAEQPDMVEAYRTAQPDFQVEGAETAKQTQQRGVDILEQLFAAHQNADNGAHILVVSHGALLKKTLAYYVGVPLTELHQLPSLPNCAHNVIKVSADKREVLSIDGEPLSDTPWAAYTAK